MIARAIICFTVFSLLLSAPFAQNIEAGLHGGLAVTGNPDYVPGGNESGSEYGVWLILSPSDRFSVAADWTFIPQDDFMASVSNSTVGERDRNRQYVDLTLQLSLWRGPGRSVFAEVGGGSHWNNRKVINPDGIAQFEEAGKESSRSAVWTLGAGFRQRIFPHLNWISQVKLHNPGHEEKHGVRFLSGLAISWK